MGRKKTTGHTPLHQPRGTGGNLLSYVSAFIAPDSDGVERLAEVYVGRDNLNRWGYYAIEDEAPSDRGVTFLGFMHDNMTSTEPLHHMALMAWVEYRAPGVIAEDSRKRDLLFPRKRGRKPKGFGLS